MPKAKNKTGSRGSPPPKEDTCRDMFADSDSEDSHAEDNVNTRELGTQSQVSHQLSSDSDSSQPDVTARKFDLVQHEATRARWKLKMAAATTEICAMLQVSDKLQDLGEKEVVRAQSVPPETKHGEDKYFTRSAKLEVYAHQDRRRSRSQGDICVGEYFVLGMHVVVHVANHMSTFRYPDAIGQG